MKTFSDGRLVVGGWSSICYTLCPHVTVLGYDYRASGHSVRGGILQMSPVFPHRVSSQTSCVKVSLSQSPASICCSGLQYNEGLRSLIKALKSPTGNYPETNHLPQTEIVFEAGSS